MNTDRRAILSLIAMGRISPRDAERLLAVWPGGEDVLVRLALCLAFVWLVLSQFKEGIAGFTRALLALVPGVHHAIAYVMHGMGGL